MHTLCFLLIFLQFLFENLQPFQQFFIFCFELLILKIQSLNFILISFLRIVALARSYLAVQAQIFHLSRCLQALKILNIPLRRNKFQLQLLQLPLPLHFGRPLGFQTSLTELSPRQNQFQLLSESLKGLFYLVFCNFDQIPQFFLKIEIGPKCLGWHHKTYDIQKNFLELVCCHKLVLFRSGHLRTGAGLSLRYGIPSYILILLEKLEKCSLDLSQLLFVGQRTLEEIASIDQFPNIIGNGRIISFGLHRLLLVHSRSPQTLHAALSQKMLLGVHLKNFIPGVQQIPDQVVLVCHTGEFLQKRDFQFGALGKGLCISLGSQQGKHADEWSRNLVRWVSSGYFFIFLGRGLLVAVGQKLSALFIAYHILLSRKQKHNHKMNHSSIEGLWFCHYINMIASAQIQNKLRDIDKNPQIMRQAQGIQETFMREWLNTGSQIERKQFSYVWSLIHGWEMELLSSKSTLFNRQTQTNSQKLFSKETFQKFSNMDMDFLTGENNVVQYLSKGQMVIKFQNNLILINPSQAYSFIVDSQFPFILVLTEANISQILDLFRLPTKNAKLITTQAIYRKIKTLSSFLAQNQLLLSIPTIYLLKPDEYFEYAKIIWQMRQNCWYEHSNDLHISFPHTRQAFLIESHKLDQTKLIYYGWKKNLIAETNYQKYIRQWQRNILRAAKQPFIIDALPSVKKEKVDWYLTFIGKQLIDSLDTLQQDHLFACCEVVTLIPNQIIMKKGYRFDYLFIILQGNFQIREPSPHIPANPHKLYGLQQLKNRQELYSFTLASTTNSIIMRLDKGNMMFHLYDLFH